MRCQGRENYKDYCTSNGPDPSVWLEILAAGVIIFGLFWLYLKWSSRPNLRMVIEWNDSDEDSSTEYDYGDPIERDQRPKRHMERTLSQSQKSLRAAKKWLSKQFSSQKVIKGGDLKLGQQPKQNSQTSFYSAPLPSTGKVDTATSKAQAASCNTLPQNSTQANGELIDIEANMATEATAEAKAEADTSGP